MAVRYATAPHRKPATITVTVALVIGSMSSLTATYTASTAVIETSARHASRRRTARKKSTDANTVGAIKPATLIRADPIENDGMNAQPMSAPTSTNAARYGTPKF